MNSTNWVMMWLNSTGTISLIWLVESNIWLYLISMTPTMQAFAFKVTERTSNDIYHILYKWETSEVCQELTVWLQFLGLQQCKTVNNTTTFILTLTPAPDIARAVFVARVSAVCLRFEPRAERGIQNWSVARTRATGQRQFYRQGVLSCTHTCW